MKTIILRNIIVFSIIFLLYFSFKLTFTFKKVQGNSMFPTLKDGQLVLVQKFGPIHNGDIIVFNHLDKVFIKRVLRSPGDSFGSGNWISKEKGYYVLGDNLNDSYDSRFYGAISPNDVLGKVIWK